MPGTIPDYTDSGVKIQNISHKNLLLDLGLEPGLLTLILKLNQKTISILQKRLSMGQGNVLHFRRE